MSVDPSHTSQIADTVIQVAEQLDAHYAASQQQLDTLFQKAYAGIKAHTVKGEVREAKAVWEPIIDPLTFDRVQKLLSKNYCTKKSVKTKDRYPFLLAGLVYCATCGDRLSGKSAHGNGGASHTIDALLGRCSA